MNRLLTLTLVLAMTSFALAVTVEFEVDATDSKEHYDPGDIIRINIASNNIFDVASYFEVSNIISDNEGQATGPRDFWPSFVNVVSKGTLVNGGDPYVLISTIQASTGFDPGPFQEYYYYFEFEVPHLAEPGLLTIDDYGQTSIGYSDPWNPGWEVNNIQSLQLNVVPEPATILLLGLGGLSLLRKHSAK